MIDVFAESLEPPPRTYGSRQILMCVTTVLPLPPIGFNPINEGEEDYEVEEPMEASATDDHGGGTAPEDDSAVAATDDDAGPVAVDSGTRVAAAAVVIVATAAAAAVITAASETNSGDVNADDTIACDAPRQPNSPEST